MDYHRMVTNSAHSKIVADYSNAIFRFSSCDWSFLISLHWSCIVNTTHSAAVALIGAFNLGLIAFSAEDEFKWVWGQQILQTSHSARS